MPVNSVDLTPMSPFTKWRQDTEIAIRKIFKGDQSHIDAFTAIRYDLTLSSGLNPKEEEGLSQRTYDKGLDQAEAILMSFINEIKEYPTKETPQEDLQPPNTFTIHWALEHVPLKFWVWFASLLLAAFIFGIAVGQISPVREIFSLFHSPTTFVDKPKNRDTTLPKTETDPNQPRAIESPAKKPKDDKKQPTPLTKEPITEGRNEPSTKVFQTTAGTGKEDKVEVLHNVVYDFSKGRWQTGGERSDVISKIDRISPTGISVLIPKITSSYTHVQLYQKGIPLIGNQKYLVRLTAIADKIVSIDAGFYKYGPPWNVLQNPDYATFDLSPEKKTIEREFRALATNDNAAFSFYLGDLPYETRVTIYDLKLMKMD